MYKFAVREYCVLASLRAWQSLPCLWPCSLALSTVTELRGFSALLWQRKMWGEVAFLELKSMSSALPSQVLGLCGYIPDPSLLWLCARLCSWRAM